MYAYEWRKFLNNEQKAEIKETFHIFDKLNENRLYFDDFKSAFMALGFNLSPEDVERIINNYKKIFPENNYFYLENFQDLVGMRLKSRDVGNEHKKLYDNIKKSNNSIDINLLKEICLKFHIEYNQENLDKIIKNCDLDKDGVIGEEDFLNILKKTNLL